MRWIYRLQQQVAITRSECNLVLVLALLFCLGLTVRFVQKQPPTMPDTVYAEVDAQFKKATHIEAPAHVEVERPTVFTASLSVVKNDTVTAPDTAEVSLVRMNLNTASSAQLDRLPRIGPKMAARIIAYREEKGGFTRVQDLVNVRGIGEKTLKKLEPFVFVEGEG